MRETIDGAAFRDMIICAAAALDKNKSEINELNVFPVPDGDTGTNMSLTMSTAVKELAAKEPKTLGMAAEITASALLRGARGNSGVILSLLFRGMAKQLKGLETADSYDLALALVEGVEAAYRAVMKPAEGTILTVSRVSSEAAVEFAENGSDIELMLIRTAESARAALRETVNQNPVLKKAGVIDAGGRGYVIILEAMLASLQGRALPVLDMAQTTTAERADFSGFETADIKFAYCTEFIVERINDKSPDLLRAFLEGIGDSIVVVDDSEIIKTHVHTNEPGKVLTTALTYGNLQSVKIENMRLQHTQLDAAGGGTESAVLTTLAAPEKKFGVVTICAGEGMENLFVELGVDGIVTGGQTMNPSTEDILSEIEKTPAETVFVLPNNKNIIMAAEQCVPLSKKKVIVIPTTTVPQGVAAMLEFDTAGDELERRTALTEAAKRVSTAQITYATRDSDFDGHTIREGEYLLLLNGALVGSFTETSEMFSSLCDAFEKLDPEFISVYYGSDVSAEEAELAVASISGRLPDAELSLISGGQPVYYYMISAE